MASFLRRSGGSSSLVVVLQHRLHCRSEYFVLIKRFFPMTPPKPKPQPAYLFAKHVEDVDYCLRTSAARSRTTNVISALWIASFRSSDRVYPNLDKFLRNIDLWHVAYQRTCYSNGLWSPKSRVGEELLDELESLKNCVCEKRYVWGGQGQVFVYPPDKPETEPRKVRRFDEPKGAFQDEIVQEILLMILEPLYEARLSQRAFGYRPGRSAQSCLRYVQGNFDGTVWTVKGDLTRLFDDPQPELLTRVLSSVIQDERITDLIFNGLNRRIRLEIPNPRPIKVCWSKHKKKKLDEEPPKPNPFWLDAILGFAPVEAQKAIRWGHMTKLSPLLANIYLNELDVWMESQMTAFFRPHDPNLKPEHEEVASGEDTDEEARHHLGHKYDSDGNDEDTYKSVYLERGPDDGSSDSEAEELAKKQREQEQQREPERPKFESEEKRFKQQMAVISGEGLEHMCDNSKRIEYVRFGGHFLVSVRGTRYDALKVMEDLRCFCKETFFMDPELDPPVHITRKTYFLGHHIFRRRLIITRRQLFSDNRYRTIRIHKTVLCVKADMQYCMHKLREIGVLKGVDNPQACFRLFHAEQAHSNAHINRLLRALSDLYKYAFNRKRVCGLVGYVFRSSLAKMYAAKYKLRSQAKVYKTGSSDLSYQLKDRKGRTPAYRAAVNSGMSTNIEPIEFRYLDKMPEAVFAPLPRNWVPVHERLLREFASLKDPATLEAELEALKVKSPEAVKNNMSNIVCGFYGRGMSSSEEDVVKKRLRNVATPLWT